MKDVFTNSGGDVVSQGIPGFVVRMSQHQLAADKAIGAYKRNIATPDVHIADRSKSFVPVVLGEDGEEMTFERRQQLMVGKQPMFDENGEPLGYSGDPLDGAEDYRGQFDGDIESERLGESAENNRGGYQAIQPKELELPFEVDEDTLEAATGAVIHEAKDEVGCVYTTGVGVVKSLPDFNRYLFEGFKRLTKETGLRATHIYVSEVALKILKEWCEAVGTEFAGESIFGCMVVIDNSAKECIRVLCDPLQTVQPAYASMFLDLDLFYEMLSREETGTYPAAEDND